MLEMVSVYVESFLDILIVSASGVKVFLRRVLVLLIVKRQQTSK